jgi:hypothetical protein
MRRSKVSGVKLHPWHLPTLMAGACAFTFCYFILTRLSERKRIIFCLSTVPLVIPGVLYVSYYFHLFDDAQWFYELRSYAGTELLASGMAFPAAFVFMLLHKHYKVVAWSVPLGLGLVLSGPYIKPIIAPLKTTELKEQWKDGACLQSSSSTCGPASAASLLRGMHVSCSERELAVESYSTAMGTENWYLARALRKRGLGVSYEVRRTGSFSEIPTPSIAGVYVGGGHFVAVIGQTPDSYLIADPLSGTKNISKSSIAKGESFFTGFFMKVQKASE